MKRLISGGIPGGVTVSAPRDAGDGLWQHEQSYKLTVRTDGIALEAKSRQGVFYGAQTLAQLIGNGRAVPTVEIRDWPAIPRRLVMIATDQGGFQIIDIEYWQRVIRELAAVKINAVMPYFDAGTYKYRKYPFLGRKGDDGFTVEKGKLLSAYAAEHFVE